MAATKTNKGKAAASESAAAIAEANGNGAGHKLDFRGLEITLPPKLHESVIWRFGILREGDLQGIARVVESVIGREQFDLVLQKMDEDDLYVDPDSDRSPMVDFLEQALEKYGLAAGESSASSES